SGGSHVHRSSASWLLRRVRARGDRRHRRVLQRLVHWSEYVTEPAHPVALRLLARTTADPERANAFLSIAQILAEGAPLGTGLIKNGSVTGRFSMVAALVVDDVNGQPVDSQYTVIGYEGNAPDSVVVFNATSTAVFSLVSDHAASVGTIGGTVAITPGAPGTACKSLFEQAPPDLDAPTPIGCTLQTVQASFTVSVGAGGDSISLPNQQVAGIRLETTATD